MGRRLAGHPLTLNQQEIHYLMNYDWPGNVRELIAVIERAALLGDGRQLHIARSLGVTQDFNGGGVKKPDKVTHEFFPNTPITLDDVNRNHIEKILARCNGTIDGPSGAARMLDIHPQTLRARMKKLGIKRTRFTG